MMNRRRFIALTTTATAGALLQARGSAPALANYEAPYLMTVRGKLNPAKAGSFLPHEHTFTDFTGAEKVPQPQYARNAAFDFLMPRLKKLKASGVDTIAECTPAYIGRDAALLQQLSKATGINILTNTGYYAAVDFKYIPAHAHLETAEQLAARWLTEWHYGIDSTGIRPGFIKLGVGNGPLKLLEKKLILAAAQTHLKSGLKIAIHTGNGEAAAEELELLGKAGVSAAAMIWVHAQNDNTGKYHTALAAKGCWISLDGFNGSKDSLTKYVADLQALKTAGHLHRVLISHDDGFAVVKKDNAIQFERFGNGDSKPYSAIHDVLRPALLQAGFTVQEFDQLTVANPKNAFSVEIHPKEQN